MPNNIKDLINEIELLVRSGHKLQAQKRLRSVQLKKIPPPLRATFAALARRTHQPQLALRFLGPIVRPSRDRTLAGTEQEQVQYGASLIKVGAIDEALDLFKRIHPLPAEGLLFTAFGYIAKWDYASSIPLLEQYVRSSEVSEYQRLVGNINLAAALVIQKKAEAIVLLDELEKETKKKTLRLLQGRLLLLKTEWLLGRKEFRQARDVAFEAFSILKNTGGNDCFYAQKWMVSVDVLESGGSKQSLANLAHLQQEAIGRKIWETTRDCDLLKAIALKDDALIVYLYFGSPLPGYRERIFPEYGKEVEIPSSYLWNPSRHPHPKKELKLNAGAIPGQLMHRTLCVLASDFYRPFEAAALHAKLYPEEVYDPYSSHHRVRELIFRIRDWLSKNRLPLTIENFTGSYALHLKHNCALWVSGEAAQRTPRMNLLDSLRDHFSMKSFSVKEASPVVNVSANTLLRALHDGLKEGIVRRFGKGPATRYQLLPVEVQLDKAS